MVEWYPIFSRSYSSRLSPAILPCILRILISWEYRSIFQTCSGFFLKIWLHITLKQRPILLKIWHWNSKTPNITACLSGSPCTDASSQSRQQGVFGEHLLVRTPGISLSASCATAVSLGRAWFRIEATQTATPDFAELLLCNIWHFWQRLSPPPPNKWERVGWQKFLTKDGCF